MTIIVELHIIVFYCSLDER